MKVAVLGSKGLLGSDLLAACVHREFETYGFDLPEMDITRMDSVRESLPQVDWVINCAGYTSVDAAESDRDEAFRVNADGAHVVARVCNRRRIRLLHISSDYVFDGNKSRPYNEKDSANPLSVYGTSKLAGEKAVRSEGLHFLVVRTQALFGVSGPSFVRRVVDHVRSSDAPFRAIRDQIISPTYTKDLSEALITLMRLNQSGVVHVAASGECSWYELAVAVAERIKPGAAIKAITSAEAQQAAPRPSYSALDTRLYHSWTQQAMRSWQEGLDAYLADTGAV